jgi:hypothetical protein
MTKRICWLAAFLAVLATLVGCGSTRTVTHTRTVTQTVTSATKNVPLVTAAGKLAPPGWFVAGGRPHAPGFGTPPPGDYGLNRPTAPLNATIATVAGFDAVDLTSIPSGAAAVGCYNSGPYTNCYVNGNAAHRFPHAHLVSIAVQWYDHTANGHPDECLDDEPGDATPSEAGPWVRTQIVTYHVAHPCVYGSASEWSSISANLSANGLQHCGSVIVTHCYMKWVAAWDNNPTIPAGFDAKQWFGNIHCCYDRDSFSTAFLGTSGQPVTFHYERFGNVPIKTKRWGTIYEVRVVKAYDSLRPHWRQHHRQLLRLRYQMQYLSTRLSTFQKGKHPYRLDRIQELNNRGSLAVECKSWSDCVKLHR